MTTVQPTSHVPESAALEIKDQHPTASNDPIVYYNPNLDPVPKTNNAVNINAERAKVPPKTSGYEHLTSDEIDHFLEHGWIRVENAVNPKYLDEWTRDFWARCDFDPKDKSTWKEEYKSLSRQRETTPKELMPEAWNKMVELAGGEHMVDLERERLVGDNFVINFGTAEMAKIHDTPPPPGWKGWHTDDDWYRQFLDSSGDALTVIVCWSDIPERGGGTWLCEDGTKGVCEYLLKHPEGLDVPHREPLFEHIDRCTHKQRIVAKKGDVFITHSLIPHSASTNHLHYARIITNPHLTLAYPFNFNRPDGKYTLLEQFILKQLGRESLPEWKPARERAFWYGYNSAYKRPLARPEAQRMVDFAKANGYEVHPLWINEGSPEFDTWYRTQGFNLPINEVGKGLKQISTRITRDD